jgi:hypothetical protein
MLMSRTTMSERHLSSETAARACFGRRLGGDSHFGDPAGLEQCPQ